MLAFAISKDIIAQIAKFAKKYISLCFKFKREGLMSRLYYI
jgi:hypothetical protein